MIPWKFSRIKSKYSKTSQDTTSWDTNRTGTRFQKGFKNFQDKQFWDMNLAGYDFKKYLKVFDVSDFTQFSFNGFVSHFNP